MIYRGCEMSNPTVFFVFFVVQVSQAVLEFRFQYVGLTHLPNSIIEFRNSKISDISPTEMSTRKTPNAIPTVDIFWS